MSAFDGHRFIEVAVDGVTPSATTLTLTYTQQEGDSCVQPGRLVWVPLRRTIALGVVFSTHDREPEYAVKPIIELVDDSYCLHAEQRDLALWLQRGTASSLFACAELMLPPGVLHSVTPWFERAGRGEPRTSMQGKVIDLLKARGKMSLEQLQGAVGSSLSTVLPDLERMGLVSRSYLAESRSVRQRMERWWTATSEPAGKLGAKADTLLSIVKSSGEEGMSAAEALDLAGASSTSAKRLIADHLIIEVQRPASQSRYQERLERFPTLTVEQANAWAVMEREVNHPTAKPHLIFGVTGSGKTELYLRAIAATLRQGRQAIYLVPEITLTTQLAQRVRDRFPGQVAVLHSGLASGVRQAAWDDIASGARRVIVGARSALFAPVPDLGLIVIDEEHDSSYKQDADPRYNARIAAEELARRSGAAIILGSATPSTETLWRAAQQEIVLTRLTKRATPAAPELPEVQIVDLRLELQAGHTSLLSRPLQRLMTEALSRREQVMLLLNRRGTSTVVICRTCGTAVICPNCDIPLVYHGDRRALLCHRCDHREKPQTECRRCGGTLDYFGAGTQRLEAETKKIFANARVLRWDQDVARKRTANSAILHSIERREVDVIVGTQLISKGLDLPYVTAVGIINADFGLHFPDYRASERTFQLITQMAGRAGRHTPGGAVVVQSYTPDHYALQAAQAHDVRRFYESEIRIREDLRYPPFVRMVRYRIRGETDEDCAAAADDLVRALGRHARDRGVAIEVIGPAPAFVARIRGQHQWHVILKSSPEGLDALLDGLPNSPGWSVDVDPVSLL
jgi:primosomal protein N' (replication factor Y)